MRAPVTGGGNDNRAMSRRTPIFLVLLPWLIAACTPVYNWREVRLPDAGIKLLLPCKPDHAKRTLPLAGQEVELQMAGCEAGAALFAISHVKSKDDSSIQAAQQEWRAAMLRNMQSTQEVQMAPIKLAGFTAQPHLVRLEARGRRQDGSAVTAQALWFGHGAHLYHAVVYADKLNLDAVDTFFSSIELQ